jgi:hypothetical protein
MFRRAGLKGTSRGTSARSDHGSATGVASTLEMEAEQVRAENEDEHLAWDHLYFLTRACSGPMQAPDVRSTRDLAPMQRTAGRRAASEARHLPTGISLEGKLLDEWI